MLVLEIIILILLFVVLVRGPSIEGMNRAHQVLDNKLDQLIRQLERIENRLEDGSS